MLVLNYIIKYGDITLKKTPKKRRGQRDELRTPNLPPMETLSPPPPPS